MSELERDNKNKRNWEKKEKEETKESGARVKIFNATPPLRLLADNYTSRSYKELGRSKLKASKISFPFRGGRERGKRGRPSLPFRIRKCTIFTKMCNSRKQLMKEVARVARGGGLVGDYRKIARRSCTPHRTL